MAEALCKFGSGDGGSCGKNTTRRSILDALEESRSLAAEETTGYGREERIEECMQRFLDVFHGDVLEEILMLMRYQGDKVELSSEDEVHAIAVEKVLQAESSRGKKLLTLEEKTSYFETFLGGRCGEVVPLICRVYQLQDSSLSDMYSRRIAELLPERGAKELSKWIIPLEIGDRFFPPFLVRHCIAANAWTVLDQLVAKYAHVGLVAVNLYDQFLGMSKCERIAAYTGIQPTPWDPVGFNPRVSDDRLIGWCRVLGIDFRKHCPGLRKQRALRVFRFFVDATFFNRTMSYDAFSEMSEALTKRVPHVLPGFPDYLDWRELHHEAAKWAKKYDLGHTLLTDIARTAMRELSEAELTAESQATIGEVDGPFYELRIPFSSVHWIDTEDAFCHFMRPLLETVDVVGIDGEWVVPEFGPAQSMAVMQIATREEVYLVDMVALRESVAGEAGRLLKTMFTSTKVKKLGFDLKQDFRILSNIDDNLADLRKTSKCVIDMFSLLSHRKRFEKPVYGGQARISQGITFTGVLFPKKEGKMTPSKVIPHILGKPLDKREQESNWERRPLRRAQLEYAALDAYYLLDIFDTLQTRVESSGCPVQAFWDDVMMELEKIRLELLELEHHSKNRYFLSKMALAHRLPCFERTSSVGTIFSLVAGLRHDLPKIYDAQESQAYSDAQLASFLKISVNVYEEALGVLCCARQGLDCPPMGIDFIIFSSTVRAVKALREQHALEEPSQEKKLHIFNTLLEQRWGVFVPALVNMFLLYDEGLSNAYVAKLKELMPKSGTGDLPAWAMFLDVVTVLPPEEIVMSGIKGHAWTTLTALVREHKNFATFALRLLDEYIFMADGDRKRLYPAQSLELSEAEVLKKLLQEWSDLAKLSLEEHCPFIREERAMSFLGELVEKTFTHGTTSYEAFKDWVGVVLERCPRLGYKFVSCLLTRRLPIEARKWIQTLRLDATRLSSRERAILSDATQYGQCLEIPSPGGFYELPVHRSSMYYVTTEKSLKNVTTSLVKRQVIGVGFQVIMPEFGPPQRLSLLQLAARDVVYLVDMVMLRGALGGEAGRGLMEMFASPTIIKLGFQILACLKLLAGMGTPLNNLVENVKNVLDLAVLFEHPGEFAIRGDTQGRDGASVSVLLGSCIPGGETEKDLREMFSSVRGVILDTREQDSYWGARPLRGAQMVYAASAAYCLVEAFDHLLRQNRDAGHDDRFFLDLLQLNQEQPVVGNAGTRQKPNQRVNEASSSSSSSEDESEVDSKEPTRISTAATGRTGEARDGVLYRVPEWASTPEGRAMVDSVNQAMQQALWTWEGAPPSAEAWQERACEVLKQMRSSTGVPLEERERSFGSSVPRGQSHVDYGLAIQENRMQHPGGQWPLMGSTCIYGGQPWIVPEFQQATLDESVHFTRRQVAQEFPQVPTGFGEIVPGRFQPVREERDELVDRREDDSRSQAVAWLADGLNRVMKNYRPGSCIDHGGSTSGATGGVQSGGEQKRGRQVTKKFVTDKMLAGLGMALLDMGLDVVVVKPNDHLDHVLAHDRGERVVLSQGKAAMRLKHELSDDMCFNVQQRSIHDQIQEFFDTFGDPSNRQ